MHKAHIRSFQILRIIVRSTMHITEPPVIYILPCRLNSFTRSLEVSTLLILEGKGLAREFASSD